MTIIKTPPSDLTADHLSSQSYPEAGRPTPQPEREETAARVLLRVCVCVVCACVPGPAALAQNGGPHDKASQQPAEKAVGPRKGQARRAEKIETAVRRQQSLWLLDSVEVKARKLEPGILQVRTLAEVADTLWLHDEVRARSLFAEAFEAIDSIKLDVKKDQRARLAAAVGGLGPLTDLRAEVLKLIAARDFKLADRLREGLGGPGAEAGRENPRADLNEQEELAWDVAIASAGTQPRRTARFVRERLREGIDEALGPGLVGIRRANPQLAEQLFAEALAAARADLAGVESLESLSAYVLPAGHEAHEQPAAPDRAGAAARRNFLSYVSERLKAQSASGHTPAAQGAEAQLEYKVLQALLPLFESDAPEKGPPPARTTSRAADREVGAPGRRARLGPARLD